MYERPKESTRFFLGMVVLALAACATPRTEAPQLAAPTALEWLERPDSDDFERAYPPEALRRGIGARVLVECVVAADGRLEGCSVVNEEPSGLGFADAAIQVSREFRAATHTPQGQPTAGGRVRVPLNFHLR